MGTKTIRFERQSLFTILFVTSGAIEFFTYMLSYKLIFTTKSV